MRSFAPLVKSSLGRLSRPVYDTMIMGVWLFAVSLYVDCSVGMEGRLFVDGIGGAWGISFVRFCLSH